MNFVSERLAFIMLFAVMLTLNSCREEDDVKTEEKMQLDMLNGTWTMTSAINGGIERSNEFVNMKITFAGTYTPGGIYNLSTNADDAPSDSPWNTNDTFKFNTSYIRGLINRQSDLRLIRYGFLHAVNGQLLIEYDDTETDPADGNWQFFFTR